MFSLFVATEQYEKAASLASKIGAEEQRSGNYKAAHDVLLNTYTQLNQKNATLPQQLKRNLVLLHSYVLVKVSTVLVQHCIAVPVLMVLADHI